MEYWQKAADQNFAYAQLNLGTLYCCGIGVDKDIDKAIEWFKKAAIQGNDLAQQNLDILQIEK